MTGEEAKIALYCLKANSDYHSEVCEECVNYPNCDHTMQDDVTETIIEALEQQEDCANVISRQAVLSMQYRIDDSATLSTRDVVNVDDIEDLPSVTPRPKTGRWIDTDDYYQRWKCSECGCHTRDVEPPFCPNCGIKMESEVEE